MEPMPGGNKNVATLILFEDTDCENQSYGPSETSMLDTQSTESCDPSTSGCSSSQSTPATVAERCSNPRSMETTIYEATLDPATRLALIRKRKQRTTAAARLDNTLSGFVEWVRESVQRKEANMKERDKEDIFFQKEIINNLRVASTCLQRLTQYLTESPSEFNVGKAGKKTKHVENGTRISGSSSHRDKLPRVLVDKSDSEADISYTADSGNSCEEDSEDEGSVSLLSGSSRPKGTLPHGTGRERTQTVKRGAKEAVKLSAKKQSNSMESEGLGQNHYESSPYLIVKREDTVDDSQSFQRTPPQKETNEKENIFTIVCIDYYLPLERSDRAGHTIPNLLNTYSLSNNES